MGDIPVLKLDKFAARTRDMDLEAFVRRYKDYHLVVREHTSEETSSFRTGEVDIRPARKDEGGDEAAESSESRVPGQVLPLCKTGRNAFAGMISVGRTTNNDIVLQHPNVSKLHAFFRPLPGGEGFSITDGNSKFGTTLDGAPLVGNKAVPLESGQNLVFGKAVRTTYFSPKGLFEYIQSLRFFKKL